MGAASMTMGLPKDRPAELLRRHACARSALPLRAHLAQHHQTSIATSKRSDSSMVSTIRRSRRLPDHLKPVRSRPVKTMASPSVGNPQTAT